MGSALAAAGLLHAESPPIRESSAVPVTVDGEVVRLVMRVYRPAGGGPAPTLVFNHGSTGGGRDPQRMARPIDHPVLAEFFARRGWAVVMPARRGRGGSEGEYDEGFEDARSAGYACDPAYAIPGADRALRDIRASMGAILAMPFVDRSRIVIGGQSRGGILSVAYAGQHPDGIRGVINFVGGWSGSRCVTDVNRTLFERGGRYPGETLWLYGEGDLFYSMMHSRGNFDAFRAAGGKGTFHALEPPTGTDGHRIVDHAAPWASVVEAYLERLGLPARR